MAKAKQSLPSEARVSIRLSPQVQQSVEEIMKVGGMSTMAEAVSRAIGNELFLQREQADGYRVILQKGPRFKQVIWPPRN
jgi:hypothetical protein